MASWKIIIASAAVAAVTATGRGDDNADEAFFRQHAEPLLKAHCYECHSHRAEKTRAGLTLDSRSGWQTGGESGPAVVPGNPDASLLIQAIRHSHEDLRMPNEKPKLAAADIATLEEWVRRGAPDPRISNIAADAMQQRIETARREHWAFQPIASPRSPEIPAVEHPVDRFVRARLAASGIEPSPPADPRVLVRRLYFDLIGLPPPFEVVEKFAAAPTAEAFSQLVDDLLARPEYGQRWARHWLDVARYADTFELSVDGERRIPFAHTYRDYVVDALNDDKPFDRFIVEQIAGDLLPDTSAGDLRGLGLYHVGRNFVSIAEGPALRVDDRIDVISRGFLGLTLACARCHDHKFDPLPTEDYYSLYGILDSFQLPLELPEVSRSGDEKTITAYLEKRAKILADYDAHVDACFAASKEHFRNFATEYLHVLVRSSENHRTTEGAIPLDTPRGLLFYYGAPRWQKLVDRSRDRDEPFFRLWNELIDMPREGFADVAAGVIAGLGEKAGIYHPLIVEAFAENALPQSMLDVATRYGEVIGNALEAGDDSVPAGYIVDLVFGEESPVPPADREEVREDLHRFLTEKRVTERKQGEKARALKTQLAILEATGPMDRAMIVTERAEPVEPVVFVRGNPKQHGDPVPRRFLQVLDSVDDRAGYQDGGRLQLAQAIASAENPLTARVIVNRVWQQHFGRGLVTTADDFGFTGEAPSHPQLLDHLASWLIEHQWSLKALHRHIMTSQTWQQSSARNSQALERDPENRLLWRMAPRRLEFEPLRDSLLQVAGRLDVRPGGRGALLDGKNRRRALYGYTDRYRIPALLRNFDVANPDTSIAQRSETIVPLQSLYLLNSPFVNRQAAALLERAEVSAANSIDERVRVVFRLVLSREPTEDERKASIEFLDYEEGRWPSFVHSLMLSNEFTYID